MKRHDISDGNSWAVEPRRIVRSRSHWAARYSAEHPHYRGRSSRCVVIVIGHIYRTVACQAHRRPEPPGAFRGQRVSQTRGTPRIPSAGRSSSVLCGRGVISGTPPRVDSLIGAGRVSDIVAASSNQVQSSVHWPVPALKRLRAEYNSTPHETQWFGLYSNRTMKNISHSIESL